MALIVMYLRRVGVYFVCIYRERMYCLPYIHIELIKLVLYLHGVDTAYLVFRDSWCLACLIFRGTVGGVYVACFPV
jgi:hypothetical protein